MKPKPAALNQATSQLLNDLFDGQFEGQAAALGPRFAAWLAASKSFVAFAQQNQLKIRKKIRTLRDEEEREDLACELRTAFLLLQEPKFAVAYEPGGNRRGRSADYAVTFRTHTLFHVEVTRLRVAERITSLPPAEMARLEGQRLANVVCEKLGQLSVDTPNVLWVWGATTLLSVLDPDATMAALKRRAEQSDADFLARSGFAKRADFVRSLQRLNAIMVLGMDEQGVLESGRWWANNDTRHALPGPLAHRLRGLTQVG